MEGSQRYAAWDSDLYQNEVWATRRDAWYSEQALPREGESFVSDYLEQLHRQTQRVAKRIARRKNPDACVEGEKLKLTPLEKVELLPEALAARADLVSLFPLTGLPELLMEVNRWTPFTQELTHLTSRRQPSTEKEASILPALFAVLVAEATNLGLATMANSSGIPLHELEAVYEWYFRTLYRAKKGADYGVLAPTLKKDIRANLIVEHWDDLNRIAASLKDGLICPSILISKLQSMQQQNPLQQALQEVGRLAKTLHILEYVDDPLLRRRVLIGLNKGEHLHSLARDIAFGRQGRFHDRGYEAQLNRASALSLVINAIAVWNTRYFERAQTALARQGVPIPEQVWQHLSTLQWAHIHLNGSYHFTDITLNADFRPLREYQGSRLHCAVQPSGPCVKEEAP